MRARTFASVAILVLAGRPAAAADPETTTSAKSCELFAFRGSAPQAEQREVPLDARVLVAYEACESTRASISLWHDGEPVPGSAIYGWSADARWATFKPAKPLDPQSLYVVALDTERGSSIFEFTTGSSLSPDDSDARPALRVLDAQSTASSPNGTVRSAFTLELTYPKVGPLGAFYLGGQKRIEAAQDNAPALVTDRLALVDGRRTVPVLQTVETRPGEKACFSVLYENAAGKLSTSSEETCALAPAPKEAASAGSPETGCSAAPRSRAGAASAVAAVAVACVVIARRARRSPRSPRPSLPPAR